MPVKIARSTPRPSFGLRELLVASHISRLASRDAAKSLLSTLVSESSGECRLIAVFGAIVLAGTPAGQSLGSAFQAGNPAEAFGRLVLGAAAGMSIWPVPIVVFAEKPLPTR